MNREQAVKYLSFSGFSDEQIKAIEGAFSCDKCVYSTSEGCQYDDITETIPPFEDCISKQAVAKVLEDIKTDIEGLKHEHTDVSGYRWWDNAIDNALSIIDRHIGEGSEKE